MSRAAAIARGLTVGYGYQAAVALTGLALTPFLLGRLGADDYGRWLIAGQLLAVLGLLDLGVTAVLPREVARAAGAGASVAEVVRRARWLVWLQTPAVALVAAAAWWWAADVRPELAGPLAVVLGGFVVQFPLRLPAAVLAGMQDLAYAGLVQAVGWAVTTAVSVALVLAGWGLNALAVGWAAGQLAGCALAWRRVRERFPEVRAGWAWPGRAALLGQFGPGGWTSVRQLAQLLLNGADLVVLGLVAGPAAVVAYSCTVRLVGLVTNQPYLLATTALPALTELQAGGDRGRLWRACRAVGTATMVVSGGLAVAVLAVSPAFVPRWVGPEQYAGPAVVLGAVGVMVARHAAFTLLQTLFALGHDRRLAAAAVADGVVTVGATVAWVSVVGPVGVPLGSLTGLVLTNGAVAVWTLAGAEGVSATRLVRAAAPWLVRFLVVVGPTAAAAFSPFAADPAAAAALLLVGLVAYAGLVTPLFRRDPLAGYRDRFAAAVRRKLGLRPRTF